MSPTEAHEMDEGRLRQDISNEMVGLFKKHYGKGPTECQTHITGNLVVVVLGGGYTAAEQTLLEAGKWSEVRSVRMSWQDAMEARFVALVEGVTGRQVLAFMSAARQSPDLSLEVFVLATDLELVR